MKRGVLFLPSRLVQRSTGAAAEDVNSLFEWARVRKAGGADLARKEQGYSLGISLVLQRG